MNNNITDRRFIAIKFQEAKWSQQRLINHGYTRSQVRRWKNVDCFQLDSAFMDEPRSGRPRIFFKTDKEAEVMVRDYLEADTAGVVKLTAEDFKCSNSTLVRAAHRGGSLQQPTSSIHLNANCETKRCEFSDARIGADHSRTCWIDHTCLDIPPRPLTAAVWRSKHSRKPVQDVPRYKRRTSMQMLTAACMEGISKPTFSAKEVRCKRKRPGETSLGMRWVTFKVDQAVVQRELSTMVLPFMKKQKLNLLDMDNAGVFIAQREFLKSKNIATTGFASLTIKDPDFGGHPPTSPDLMLQDAAIYPVFKHEWRRECPMTVPEGVVVAVKILKDLNDRDICRKYVEHYNTLLKEVKDVKGAVSHHMQ